MPLTSTLSYVHGTSDIPLLGETLGRSFDRTVARWGDRPGLVVRSQSVRWSYAELGARADALAAGLLALGIEPGERVGIWSLNNAEWLTTQIATRQSRHHSGQHQSGLPGERTGNSPLPRSA